MMSFIVDRICNFAKIVEVYTSEGNSITCSRLIHLILTDKLNLYSKTSIRNLNQLVSLLDSNNTTA